jgi:signal transduction histidine kinase
VNKLSVRIVAVLAAGFGLYEFFVWGLLGAESAWREVQRGAAEPSGWIRPTAAVLAGILTAWAIDWCVMRRLRRLNRDVREVAGGDLARRLGSRAEDEMGELAAGINLLVDALRDNFDELRTNDELRRRLVANVSHELRTPLTSIQGYLETARNAGPVSPEISSNLDICHRETRRLARLVQDLFQLSKLDTRQLEFHHETMSFVELADQVGLAFEQRMLEKEITFQTSLPDDALYVVGDGNRLGQVITNLLGNAIVFTDRGGSITLECVQEGSQVICRVIDTGVGIASKDLPHIFDSFFHLEKSGSRNLGGTGLGLAICKAIVDAHGGTLQVESRQGDGTTFWFSLDAAAEPELVEPAD